VSDFIQTRRKEGERILRGPREVIKLVSRMKTQGEKNLERIAELKIENVNTNTTGDYLLALCFIATASKANTEKKSSAEFSRELLS
jgi:hypothetical protein